MKTIHMHLICNFRQFRYNDFASVQLIGKINRDVFLLHLKKNNCVQVKFFRIKKNINVSNYSW